MFIATAFVNQAATDEFKSKPRKALNMTFDRAIKNPSLVTAIYQQVDPVFLNKIEQLYIVEVTHNGVVYRILGSRQSWLRFFRPRPLLPGIFNRDGSGIQ